MQIRPDVARNVSSMTETYRIALETSWTSLETRSLQIVKIVKIVNCRSHSRFSHDVLNVFDFRDLLRCSSLFTTSASLQDFHGSDALQAVRDHLGAKDGYFHGDHVASIWLP